MLISMVVLSPLSTTPPPLSFPRPASLRKPEQDYGDRRHTQGSDRCSTHAESPRNDSATTVSKCNDMRAFPDAHESHFAKAGDTHGFQRALRMTLGAHHRPQRDSLSSCQRCPVSAGADDSRDRRRPQRKPLHLLPRGTQRSSTPGRGRRRKQNERERCVTACVARSTAGIKYTKATSNVVFAAYCTKSSRLHGKEIERILTRTVLRDRHKLRILLGTKDTTRDTIQHTYTTRQTHMYDGEMSEFRLGAARIGQELPIDAVEQFTTQHKIHGDQFRAVSKA